MKFLLGHDDLVNPLHIVSISWSADHAIALMGDGRKVRLDSSYEDDYAIEEALAEIIPAGKDWHIALSQTLNDGKIGSVIYPIVAWKLGKYRRAEPITVVFDQHLAGDDSAIVQPSGSVIDDLTGTVFATLADWVERLNARKLAASKLPTPATDTEPKAIEASARPRFTSEDLARKLVVDPGPVPNSSESWAFDATVASLLAENEEDADVSLALRRLLDGESEVIIGGGSTPLFKITKAA